MRLTALVLSALLGAVSTGFGYDGPSPLTYDRTDDSIRVILISQGSIRPGGRSTFTMTAFVPVVEADVRSWVDLEIRKANPAGLESGVIARCQYRPTSDDVGTTVAIPCNPFVDVPYDGWEGVTLAIYPYIVRRPASAAVPALVHDGRATPLIAQVVWDDLLEDNNDTLETSRDLGSYTQLALHDLVSADPDYFSFVVPPGMGLTRVSIEFWNTASDLDLYIYAANQAIFRESQSISDREVLTFEVLPGEIYSVLVQNYDGRPAFYDLTITHAPSDGVAIAWGPMGTPNPVAPNSPVRLSAVAAAADDAPPEYRWTAACAGLTDTGSFDNPASSTPTWYSPANASRAQQSCTISVTASKGGYSVTSSYTQLVDPNADYITMLSGPSGVPDPVDSGGEIALGVSATDSLGHALTYEWMANCQTGDAVFLPSPFVQNPTLVVPVNNTDTARGCVIAVTVSDAYGHTATASYYHTVLNRPDVVTALWISATPNPVASGGQVSLSTHAVDAFGHPVSYEWRADCAFLPSDGTFVPTAFAQSTTWVAPANATGEVRYCQIRVIASDAYGHSDDESYAQRVESVADAVSITAGPAGAPDPVASGGAVALSLSATDSVGHGLTFEWQASCAGLSSNGSFVPSATVQQPTWMAPDNVTGAQETCTIQVLVSDGHGHSTTGLYAQRVESVAAAVTIQSGPSGTPNPVQSAGPVALTLTATHTLPGVTLGYAWTATCVASSAGPSAPPAAAPAGGAFQPSASVATPTWIAPENRTGAPMTCTIAVEVTDGQGHSASGSYEQVVSSVPAAITITAPPSGSVGPVPSGGSVPVTVGATHSLELPLSFLWEVTCPGLPSSGSFVPSASVQSPTWIAPVNPTGVQQACTLTVTITNGLGQSTTLSFVQLIDPVNTITISGGPNTGGTPVDPGSHVELPITATDLLGRTLTYTWTAVCPGLPSNGSFLPSASVQSPVWVAPDNTTGVPQTCTLTVTVTDGQGQSQSMSYDVIVTGTSQSIPVTGDPSGTPNPVVSGGTVSVTISVSDPSGLTFAWSAACPGLPSNGSFSAPASHTSVWTAPANLTGSSQVCTLTVTIGTGQGPSITKSYQQTVSAVPQVVASPIVPGDNPNAVQGGGSVNLGVTGNPPAPVTYLWSATCPGLPSSGSFDDPTSATPVWTAPLNPTGQPQSCTITVVITDGQGQTQTASHTIIVGGVPAGCTYGFTPTRLTIPSQGGTVTLAVTAADTCPWSGVSNADWLTLVGAAAGSGNGSLTFSAGAIQTVQSRTGTVTVAGVTLEVVQGGTGYTYYLAEGATINGFFSTRIALLNPSATDAANVTIEFQLKDTSTVLTHALLVGAHQRATVDVAALASLNPALTALSSAEFSTVVRSDRPIVVDRQMSWDSRGYGAHAETAVTAPASTWYLAEGATIGTFELYYLIQNPSAEPLDGEIEVTYLLPPPAAPVVRTYSMGANTRRNIAVHLEPGLEDVEVSAIIRTPADKPVIVERAMYLSSPDLFFNAGHASAGIRAPQTQWFFAEGATGRFFDLFVLIGNPNDTPAHATATFLFDDGTTCAKPVGNIEDGGTPALGPKTRYNLWVDMETVPGCPRSLADAAVSTTITSDVPVIAERTMWWPGPSAATWAEAHNTPGANETGVVWALAEGEQGGPASVETYVLIANTSPFDGAARVTLYFEDGTSLEKTVELQQNGRTTVPIGAPRDLERLSQGLAERNGLGFGDSAVDRRFGIVVESLPVPEQAGPAEIVVERSSYWSGPGAPFWAAGTGALATKLQ